MDKMESFTYKGFKVDPTCYNYGFECIVQDEAPKLFGMSINGIKLEIDEWIKKEKREGENLEYL
jgi:hypothetical protein